jgi:hypothetical protein
LLMSPYWLDYAGLCWIMLDYAALCCIMLDYTGNGIILLILGPLMLHQMQAYDAASIMYLALFSAPLPPLQPGPHEIRAFVRDGAGLVKAELGSSPWQYEEAPTALGIADELARKDAAGRCRLTLSNPS